MQQQNNSASNRTKPKPASGSSSSHSPIRSGADLQARASVTDHDETQIVKVTQELIECSSRLAAVLAARRAQDGKTQMEDDNETEEDSIKAEALRRLRVRQLSKAQQVVIPDSSASPSTTGALASDMQNTSK